MKVMVRRPIHNLFTTAWASLLSAIAGKINLQLQQICGPIAEDSQAGIGMIATDEVKIVVSLHVSDMFLSEQSACNNSGRLFALDNACI